MISFNITAETFVIVKPLINIRKKIWKKYFLTSTSLFYLFQNLPSVRCVHPMAAPHLKRIVTSWSSSWFLLEPSLWLWSLLWRLSVPVTPPLSRGSKAFYSSVSWQLTAIRITRHMVNDLPCLLLFVLFFNWNPVLNVFPPTDAGEEMSTISKMTHNYPTWDGPDF